MGKQKFQCTECGAILICGRARREHCQMHHPGTPFSRLDIFFPMEFKEIGEDEPSTAAPAKVVKIIKTSTDKHGNVSYSTRVTKKDSKL